MLNYIMYYVIICYISYPILFAMCNSKPIDTVLNKALLNWMISPILVTGALLIIVIGLPFALLYKLGEFIKGKF